MHTQRRLRGLIWGSSFNTLHTMKFRFHRGPKKQSLLLVFITVLCLLRFWENGAPSSASSFITKMRSTGGQQRTTNKTKTNTAHTKTGRPYLVKVGYALTKPNAENPSNATCSCWDKNATSTNCCLRQIVVTHKMGYGMALDLLTDYQIKSSDKYQYKVSPQDVKGDKFKPKLPTRAGGVIADFRMVLITRNVYDALVSGYLYHQSGRECWLGPNGEPRRISHSRVENAWNWDLSFTFRPLPSVPRNGRSICQYLSDESEHDGMRVWIEFTLKWYWKLLWEFWEDKAQNPKLEWYGHVALACYEDLVASTGTPTSTRSTKDITMHHVVDFLFPGGFPGTLRNERNTSEDAAGGHATSTDPELRARLRSIILQLDLHVFNGTIARHQTSFGCEKRKNLE